MSSGNADTLKPTIPEAILKRQAWKYYAAMLAWPVYLFFLPWIWSRSIALGFIFMAFPGVYLFTEMGVLMHECWHRYVPNVPNDFFYQIFSWLLLTDPQFYRLLHGFHHSQVNSWADPEFHPFGQIKSRPLGVLLNISEIVFGIAALVVIQALAMPGNPRFQNKYRVSSLLTAVFIWFAYLSFIGWSAQKVFSLPVNGIVVAYLLAFWLGSLIIHHSQLIEHGNLFVSGDWNERNIKTRNLESRGWPEKIFLFLTHGDSREHVLHHVLSAVHSRPFPGRVPLPQKAVMITLRDYRRIVFEMIIGRPSTC